MLFFFCRRKLLCYVDWVLTFEHAWFCIDGESMVLIDLLYWNVIALRFPRGKNAYSLLHLVTSLQSDG
jgi:hypothetical protein